MEQSELRAIEPSEDAEKGHRESQTNHRGFSWLIAMLLLSCLALNYIDRQALAVLVRFFLPV